MILFILYRAYDDVPAIAGVLNAMLATVGVPSLASCDPAVNLAFPSMPIVDDVPAVAAVLNTMLVADGVLSLPSYDPAVASVLFCYS